MNRRLLFRLSGLLLICGQGGAAAIEPVAQTSALLAQCQAALPEAEPRQAQQLRQAMFGLQLSMAYRRAPGRMSPQELKSAAAHERRAYERLLDSCKPLLI